MKEKIDQLTKKKKQIEEQIKAIQNRERTQARIDDARKKILVGSTLMLKIKKNEFPEETLTQFLDQELKKEHDRKLFGLAPLPS